MTENKTLDQILHDKDESNKLYEFAESYLKSSPEQADTMARTLRHKFKWSGVRLLFHAENGEQLVAVDHVDQIKEYLTRSNFGFLLAAPTQVDGVNGVAASIPADVLNDALNGSLTAKGRVHILLNGPGKSDKDAVARTEMFLRSEKQKIANGGTGNDSHPHGVTRAEMNGGDHATNPFSRAGWNLSKQGSVFKALGEAKTAALAASVGSRIGSTSWNPNHPANK